jgi:hypothetical protein
MDRYHGDPLLVADKLQKLAAEHQYVAKNLKGGRYGRAQNWQYLKYLRDRRAPDK